MDGKSCIYDSFYLLAQIGFQDADAEQRNPDTFDPTLNRRDYDQIDLPVFTCSSRDYIRIKGMFILHYYQEQNIEPLRFRAS
jgi:hypothetical protein